LSPASTPIRDSAAPRQFHVEQLKTIVTFQRTRILIFAFFLWMPSQVGAQAPPVPPVAFTFDVSRAGSSIDTDFKADKRRLYHFDIRFDYVDQQDLRRVLKLVGDGSRFPDGRYGTPGIIVPIHLKVFEIEGARSRIIYDDTIATQGHYRHRFGPTIGHYDRTIANVVLNPGRYKVQATTIKQVPEFLGMTTRFSIGYDPRFIPSRE
jgi:hypothetical protein